MMPTEMCQSPDDCTSMDQLEIGCSLSLDERVEQGSPIPRDDGQLESYQLNLVDYSRMPDHDDSLAIEDAQTGLSSME